MNFATLHRWPRTARSAIALQRELAPRVLLEVPANLRSAAPRTGEDATVRDARRVAEPPGPVPRLFAGCDAAFSPDGMQVVAGVVVLDAHTQTVVEQHVARVPCNFPYVPGLLSFREVPGLLAAFRRLKSLPDVVLCDAQGLAHPRRFGLASHLGLWLDLPTVGCAKSRLCGDAVEPGPLRGDSAPLLLDGERVGTVLRTRDRVRPLYVSPGHRCDHRHAVLWTLAALTRYRLPEPTRLADQLVTRMRTGAPASTSPSWDN